MEVVWTLLMFAALLGFAFVIVGLFAGISNKLLTTTLVVGLLLVLVRVLVVLPLSLALLTLLAAIVVAARILAGRRIR